MKWEEIESALRQQQHQIKEQDRSVAPVFEDLELGTLNPIKHHHGLWLPRVAASLLLFTIGIGIYLHLNANYEVQQPQVMISDALMPNNEYIWEWTSPTKHLLNINENMSSFSGRNNQ